MMKNQIKFILALLILVSVYSCSSDFEEVDIASPEPQGQEMDGIQVLEYTNTTTKGFRLGNSSTTFLSFPNLNAFKRTITLLEARAEYHDDQFIAAHANLSNDELSNLEYQTGFNPYEPLERFGSSYNFEDSMLKDYITAEKNWLGQQILDINNDPDNFFYNLEEEELAVLNKDGVVKIGASIFKMIDGGYIEITDGNLQTLARFNEYRINDCDEILSINEYPNVNVVSSCNGGGGGGDNSSDCNSSGRSQDHWVLDGDRMIKGKVALVDSPNLWGRKIKSKTKYFKQGFLGIWYRCRSNLVAALDGKYDTEGSNCGDFALTFDEKIHRQRESHRSKAKFRILINSNLNLQELKIKSGKVKGFHYQNSNLRNVSLTF